MTPRERIGSGGPEPPHTQEDQMEFMEVLLALDNQEKEWHPDGTVISLGDVADNVLPEFSEEEMDTIEAGVMTASAARLVDGMTGSSVLLETFLRGVSLGRMVERMKED